MRRVELFIPVIMDQLYPQTAFNTMRLLERSGCEVMYDPKQTSTGIEAYEEGFWDEAMEIGSKFLKEFSGEHYIVSPSVSSVGMVRDGYNDLFTNSTEHNTCRNIQRNIFEVSDFLVNVIKKQYFGAEFVGTAIFHDACSVWNSYQIQDEPIALLKQVGGLELLGTDLELQCCKIGRAIKANYEPVSVSMGEQVIQRAIELHAEYIICNDELCLMHVQGIIAKQSLKIRAIHLVDVLTSGWPNI